MLIYSVHEDTEVAMLLAEPNEQLQRKAPLKDDLLWKAVLEDVFEDFLCFLIPNATTEFDLKRGFQFLDKELE